MILHDDILNKEYSQGITWREYIVGVMKVKRMKGSIYPVYAYKAGMDEPNLIGFCAKDGENLLFFDYQLPSMLMNHVLTIGEFVDISLWESVAECLLYHGLAIIADEKVQICAQEFGIYEAYMASHRGNYENYQELASDPNL